MVCDEFMQKRAIAKSRQTVENSTEEDDEQNEFAGFTVELSWR